MLVLKRLLLVLTLGLSLPVLADCPPVAKLVTFEGQVSIRPAGRVLKTSPGALPRALCAGDEVHTFAGRALIDDGRTAVAVDQFSVAAFIAAGKSALNQGQALFSVSKRKEEAGVEVKTRLSVIGVKGTRFLVSDKNDELTVVLDQGQVGITSTQGPVGLYRENAPAKPADEDFETYARHKTEAIAAGQAAFEQYKTQVQREFVAYVENLTLEAGKELVTVGRVAVERNISNESADSIKALSAWLGAR